METTELIEALSRGEDSRHQFKENFTNADALAAEIVAFTNTAGGKIFRLSYVWCGQGVRLPGRPWQPPGSR